MGMRNFGVMILMVVSLGMMAEPIVVKTGQPYLEDFESGATDWTFVDDDGDGYNWEIQRTTGVKFHSGSACLTSASWSSVGGDLSPNNWAIMPAVTITECDSATLSWWMTEQDERQLGDRLKVYVSTTTSDIGDFKSVFLETLENATYEQRSVDLTPYIGKTIYIAFCHNNRDSFYRINIDDVKINCTSGTGISAPKINVENEIFDLQGRKIGDLRQGINIKNGKKIIKNQ